MNQDTDTDTTLADALQALASAVKLLSTTIEQGGLTPKDSPPIVTRNRAGRLEYPTQFSGEKDADGNNLFHVHPTAPTQKCKNCGELVAWHTTPKGKRMPLDADGHCHFDTCSDMIHDGKGLEDDPF